MNGVWVFVCGPSGAGKDSVIGWAREQLAGQDRVVFAQRLETRPGPTDADHRSLDAPQFDLLHRSGGLAWHWQAHGCRYGIPARYGEAVAQGRVVVVNGSREHVAALPVQAGRHTVQLVAGDATLAHRLAQRGRDGPEAIAARLARNALLPPLAGARVIRNDGHLSEAGQALADFLLSL